MEALNLLMDPTPESRDGRCQTGGEGKEESAVGEALGLGSCGNGDDFGKEMGTDRRVGLALYGMLKFRNGQQERSSRQPECGSGDEDVGSNSSKFWCFLSTYQLPDTIPGTLYPLSQALLALHSAGIAACPGTRNSEWWAQAD